MAFYIVLIGPPGAGKGTQAKFITEKMNLPHISTGNLFRSNFKLGSDLGKLAMGYIDCGELVPDSITLAMVKERLAESDCQGGALLDGFPRTVAQAEAFDEMLAESGESVTAVPFIDVADDELVRRLSGRWTCREAGHVFHMVFQPPKEEGVCDFDGSELYQREDDKPYTVKHRIEVYQEQTSPLVDYYRNQGKLVAVNGANSIEEISQELLGKLQVIANEELG